MKNKKPIWHIIIEGHKEEQMYKFFEEIQNKYNLYDNCVIQKDTEESTIIDNERKEETGGIFIRKN